MKNVLVLLSLMFLTAASAVAAIGFHRPENRMSRER